MADNILVAVDTAGVAVVTLNRPEKRNVGVAGDVARPGRDLPRLRQARRRPGGDPDRCRRALLRRRRHLGILQGARQRGGRPQLRRGRARAATQAIIDLPQPTIAAVHGYGVGGGCGLALACDLRVGDATTQMGIPAARLSIVYGALDCSLLLRAVGLASAKLVLYSGRYFPLADCRAMGLIDVVSRAGRAGRRARAGARAVDARAVVAARRQGGAGGVGPRRGRTARRGRSPRCRRPP